MLERRYGGGRGRLTPEQEAQLQQQEHVNRSTGKNTEPRRPQQVTEVFRQPNSQQIAQPESPRPGNNKDRGYRRAGRRTRLRIMGFKQRDERRFSERDWHQEMFEESKEDAIEK